MFRALLLIALIPASSHAGMYFNKLLVDQTNPAGSISTEILDLANYAEYSVQVIATGTVACTSTLYASNDPTSKTMIAISGTASAFTNTGLLYVIKGSYRYVQQVFTGCAGAGSLKSYFIAKEI